MDALKRRGGGIYRAGGSGRTGSGLRCLREARSSGIVGSIVSSIVVLLFHRWHRTVVVLLSACGLNGDYIETLNHFYTDKLFFLQTLSSL